MLIAIIKFLHLLCVLGLLGSASYCLFLITSKKFTLATHYTRVKIVRLNLALLSFGLIAMLTGTCLVYPKHFTFYTPWIQAAYTLVTAFILGVGALLLFRHKMALKYRRFYLLSYIVLLTILILVIHDAVAKRTFLFAALP